MSPVARFRPFGRRQDGPADHEPDPWLDDAPSPVRAGHDRLTDGWDAAGAPATRAATPAMWAPRPQEPAEPAESVRGPVTDPFGFPPVPPVLGARDDVPARREAAPPAWAAWVPERRPQDVRSPWADDAGSLGADQDDAAPAGPGPAEGADGAGGAPVTAAPRDVMSAWGRAPGHVPMPEPMPDPAEAAALAGAFAADYLSWDEDDPARRGRALADHLSGPDAGHALLGWSGAGRQRAEIVLPGAVRPDGEGRLVVDVRVRVVPYRRVTRSEPTPEPDPDDALGMPAAAPPVTARGWRGLAARWVRLGVGVVRDGGRLVVDAGEETLDDRNAVHAPPEPAPKSVRPGRTGSPGEDPTLDGDDDASSDGPR